MWRLGLILLSMSLLYVRKGTHRSFEAITEICDNALDDDMDGFVDINDSDCQCAPGFVPSLISNASFENRTCCPDDNTQLFCAEDWIQASVPTTDYLHTCGWLGWEQINVPTPLPDGKGILGFRDGRPGENGNRPLSNWKEYAGTCLLQPLQPGQTYRFEFFLGFAQAEISRSFDITVYGTNDCIDLPFDRSSASFGCPTNNPKWYEMTSMPVSGANEWIKVTFEITPEEVTNAIAIGPGCQRVPSQVESYYYLDQLILNELDAFETPLEARGNPCSPDVALVYANPIDSFTYQWYKDGIAVLGETSSTLISPPGQGSYQLMLRGANGCFLTNPLEFTRPEYYDQQAAGICINGTYNFGNRVLTKEGIYMDTLIASDGCDSIIELDLQIDNLLIDTININIFPSRVLSLGDYSIDGPGQYRLDFESSTGCDSLVVLNVAEHAIYIPNAFSPNGDGRNDQFEVYHSTEIEIVHLQVFNRFGGIVFDSGQADASLDPSKLQWDGRVDGQLATPGVYVYRVYVSDSTDLHLLAGELVLIE